ncbi:MAG: hypothetical protein FIB07_15185 [Candidatus Methanoperedens sp.]|nr:hypothetical protein [Candidatus Methanoperedens sp.]
MKERSQQIDEVDEAIIKCIQAQPHKLNNIITITRLNYETGRKRLEKLKRYGYITSPNFGFYAITKPGLNLLEVRSQGIVTPDLRDDKIEDLIKLLPTAPHQAFFRLLVSGIIAKYCLFDHFNDGYPSFIIGGKTKAFKTSIAKLICLLFGFNNGLIHKLFSATAGEFGIRRVSTGNGQFRPEPSQYFNEPFICLDELDKTTSNDLKRVLLNYADGAREFPIEGEQVINHCTTLITLNTNGDVNAIKSLGIHEAYIRRSVVLNTEQLLGQLKDVDLMAKAVFDYMNTKTAPRIRLEILNSRLTRLSESDYILMRNLLMGNIAEGYENLVDTQPLELLSLGRAVLLNGDCREAIFQTTYDRLCCLETLGLSKEGWRKRMQVEWARYRAIEQPGIMEKLKEASIKETERATTLEERRAELQKQREEKTNERLEFLAERGKVAGRLGKLIETLKTITKNQSFEPQAKLLLEQSRYLRSRIEKASNQEELMTYVRPFNDLAARGKEIIDSYNSWAASQKIKDSLETDGGPFEFYYGQINKPVFFEVSEGNYKDNNGWRVKFDSQVLEIIKGNQRWAFLAEVGSFKLGNKYALHIQSIVRRPEPRILLEVGGGSTKI